MHERTIGIRNHCKSKRYFHFNNGIEFCPVQFYDSCLWTVSCCSRNIVSGIFLQLFFPHFPLAVVALVIASQLDKVHLFLFHIWIHQTSSTCAPFYWRNPRCYFLDLKTHFSRETVRNTVKNSLAPLGRKPDWGLLVYINAWHPEVLRLKPEFVLL